MSNSVILKKHKMEELFKKYPIQEVFAKTPFSFEDPSPTLLVCIPTDVFNWYDLWLELTEVYKLGLLLSVTREYTDPILKDTQMIWRGGVWLV